MTLYVDTSSLIKLYIDEPGSAEVQTLVSNAQKVATSSIAHVETRATLARHRRTRRLTAAAYASAKELFEQHWSKWIDVSLTADLLRAAADLAEQHALRALDAIHLASFVQVLERAGDEDVHFSSFDDRLTKAAKRLR